VIGSGASQAPPNALTQPLKAPAGAGVDTVPFFEGSFDYGGTTYPYDIVGSNPASSWGITVTRAVIVPIDLTFQDSRVSDPNLNGSTEIGHILVSPIFTPSRFAATGDFTQYGDAVQRAEFWNVLRRRLTYHTLLVPEVHRPVHLDVPASQGDKDDSLGTGIPLGYINDFGWWQQQLVGLIHSLHLSPREIPLFITRDVLAGGAAGDHEGLTVSQPGHPTSIYPYAWASWFDYGWATGLGFAPNFAADAEVLGHEVVEVLNDPFITNVTPDWSFSLPPLYPKLCDNYLETGDPLELAIFEMRQLGFTYHLQDEAFLSWFARQAPSIGYAGRYSFTGTFTTYSRPCS
jgi:hypothetical protein